MKKRKVRFQVRQCVEAGFLVPDDHRCGEVHGGYQGQTFPDHSGAGIRAVRSLIFLDARADLAETLLCPRGIISRTGQASIHIL